MANPLATILSSAMMLRYTFNQDEWAYRIEAAVQKVLQQGLRTADICGSGPPAGRDEGNGRRGRCRALICSQRHVLPELVECTFCEFADGET